MHTAIFMAFGKQSYNLLAHQVCPYSNYPDFDALKTKGIEDVKTYFDSEIKNVNSRMVSYKAVKMVKIRNEEFEKNTSRKILRFAIDKSIE